MYSLDADYVQLALQSIFLPPASVTRLAAAVRAYAAIPPGPARDSAVAQYRTDLALTLFERFRPYRGFADRFLRTGNTAQASHALQDSRTTEGVRPRTGTGEARAPRILLKCAAEDTESSRIDDTTGRGPARTVGGPSDVFWPPGTTLFYYFTQPEYRQPDTQQRATRREFLEDAMQVWKQYSHLGFVETSNHDQAHIRIFFREPEDRKYSEWFRRAFDRKESEKVISWTKIGRVAMTAPWGLPGTTMYLELPLEDLQSDRQTCLHELGHVHGFRHEHASPLTQTVDKEGVAGGISFWTRFDPYSIMLYEKLKLERGGKTILNRVLSETDKAVTQVKSVLT